MGNFKIALIVLGIAAVLMVIRRMLSGLRPVTSPQAPFRLTIDDFFVLETGSGVVVVGSIASGKVKKDDELAARILGGQMKVQIKTIECENPATGRFLHRETAVKGDRVALRLSGLHKDQIRKGDELTDLTSRTPSRRRSAPGAAGQFSDPSQDAFQPGQVWAYRTRPGEKASRLTILKVERLRDETIVHVQISGVSIANAAAPDGISRLISHMPFTEEAIELSVLRLVDQRSQLPPFEELYAIWKDQSEKGKAGTFVIPVADAIEGLAKVFQKTASQRSG